MCSKINWGILALAFVVFSCKKEKIAINNLNNNKIEVIGHGGMGIDQSYPLNSLESFLAAIGLNANGIEFDVQVTKDSVLVAFHDEFLESITNGNGRVNDKTWDELKDLRYQDPLFASYKIVRLTDLFSSIDNVHSYSYFFDCKKYDYNSNEGYIHQLASAIVKLVNQFDISESVHIECRREDLIQSLLLKSPGLKVFVNEELRLALEYAKKYSLRGILSPVDQISKEEITLLHEKGLMVVLFNANSRKRNKDAIEKNADFIQTDLVKHLVKQLN